jgi:dihydroorotate dehydrogenase electron transfer subunit
MPIDGGRVTRTGRRRATPRPLWPATRSGAPGTCHDRCPASTCRAPAVFGFEILRDTAGADGLTILRRIGASTALLYEKIRGQRVDCLGPLGRPFTVVDPPGDAWMVAGGVGLAPFATLAQALHARGVKSTLFYGARRGAELFYLDFFRALDVELVLATEDGSAGELGRVVAPLERRLAARAPESPVMLYACGPEGMLAATARTAMKYRRPCQVSVERVMGCGLGGCYSCVVPMRDEHGGFHHVRSCIAGPVAFRGPGRMGIVLNAQLSTLS